MTRGSTGAVPPTSPLPRITRGRQSTVLWHCPERDPYGPSSVPFLSARDYCWKHDVVEYAGIAAPCHLPRGRRGAGPAVTGGAEPCDGSLHQHRSTRSAEKLRERADVEVYTGCVRGREKEELAVEGLGHCKGKAARGPIQQKC